MANDFFSASGNPATASQGSSATMRAEFSSIEDGFDKLPTLTGNGGKVVAVNSGGTALEAIANVPVSKGGTGQTTYTDGQLLIGNSSGNTLAKSTLTAGSNIVITNGNGSITISATGSGGGGVGSVTSVAQTFTGGLISVSGSPITTSGTLALTVAGTSGGIPYFSSASTWASSAALTNNAIMLGGGAGGAPKTTTTGTGVVTALGINVGSAGSFVVNGGAGSFTTVTTTGVLTGPDGSASAPTYSFSSSGNSDNGMYLSAANEVSLSTAGTKQITVTSDGRLYGTALHNNAGAVTGTTNQYIASGTYTPTLVNHVNVAASTARVCQWMRVGNVVTVSGVIEIDPTTASTFFSIGIYLPIASSFSESYQCAGTAASANYASGDTVATIRAAFGIGYSPQQALLSAVPSAGSAYDWWFHFTYVVV